MPPSFTTLVAVDAEHIRELRAVWPTWRQFKPEILANPMLIVCDGALGADQSTWRRSLSFVDHPSLSLNFYCGLVGFPQRERMLTALVAAAELIRTPYFLKLDCDAVATGPGQWICDHWFTNEPAFIAHPWRYTKPSNTIQELDKWGDRLPELSHTRPLRLHFNPAAHSIPHSRIISWCYFGNTAWTRRMWYLAVKYGNRLPVPSHDTYLWYMAERTGAVYRRVNMKARGWDHVHPRRLEHVCQQVLRETGVS